MHEVKKESANLAEYLQELDFKISILKLLNKNKDTVDEYYRILQNATIINVKPLLDKVNSLISEIKSQYVNQLIEGNSTDNISEDMVTLSEKPESKAALKEVTNTLTVIYVATAEEGLSIYKKAFELGYRYPNPSYKYNPTRGLESFSPDEVVTIFPDGTFFNSWSHSAKADYNHLVNIGAQHLTVDEFLGLSSPIGE